MGMYDTRGSRKRKYESKGLKEKEKLKKEQKISSDKNHNQSRVSEPMQDTVQIASTVTGAAASDCRRLSFYWTNIKTPKIQVCISTLIGKDIWVSIAPEKTIEDLKTKIQDKEGIPMDQQRLVFNGEQLRDDRTLTAYSIGNKDTLHLIFRLRGC